MPKPTDEYDVNQTWPRELPDNLRDKLQRDIDFYAQIIKMRKDAPAASQMKTDAMEIGKAAQRLLKQVRLFSSAHQITIYENHRQAALERLKEGLEGLTTEELERCRSGMDVFSLQWPLIGLIHYADILSDAPPGLPGRQPTDREIVSVKEIIRCFKAIRFECSNNANGLLFRTCKVFFARAGKPKGDDAIAKYLRAASA